MGITTTILLDERRALKDGTYPVKLRITFRRKQKHYPTQYCLTKEEFEKTQSQKPRGVFKEMQLSFQAIEQKARGEIEKLQAFTFEAFEKRFLENSTKDDVFAAFSQYVNQLSKEGRAATASSYNCACHSLQEFSQKKALSFCTVTPAYLREYEKWMLNQGKSLTTVGIYLRPLRAVYNDAIASGDVKSEFYPFGKRKYQIPAGQNIKKALNLSDVEKIFNYQTLDEREAKARDLWIFSYLCNGINIKDVARLKYKNVKCDKISFIRAKTERTSRQNLKTIEVALASEAKEVIERWGNKPALSDSFVFPILTEGLTPEKELGKVRQATKTINNYIQRIAKTLDIEKKVTTYTARHTFSTVLKRAGVSVEFISESLGHNNVKTTENYLDSFEDDTRRQFTSHLTAFKKSE